MTEACSICSLLSGSAGSQRVALEGAEIIAPVRHVSNWRDLTASEQLALLGNISEVLASSSSASLSMTTRCADSHFHLHVGASENPAIARGDATLIAGGNDPLFPHLVSRIDSSNHVDLAVAFALESGVALLAPYLQDLLARGGKLRIVVGDYFDVTEPVALRRLMDFEGDIERYVFEAAGGSFHPKAWVFRAIDQQGGAVVGSSNLTSTALTKGVEWNLAIGTATSDWQHVAAAFEALLQRSEVKPLSNAWIDAYAKRRKMRPLPEIAQSVASESPSEAPPKPHDIQQAALTALKETRADGSRAGLVVLATGLGKTWLAAFDSLPFDRILFVAHREEILAQAMTTFRRVRPEARFGKYTGDLKEDGDIIFASIQTIGRAEHLARFDPDAFDYIVIDEFHHAAAASYQALLDHFTPRFLLGLTATPERTDGGDLLGLCGENLVFHCDLHEGIRSGRLVPFRYFGVPDEIDYAQIPWRSSRFDEEALTSALATSARAKNALEQFHRRRLGPAIGFCCSQRHADFMADFFVKAGLRAVAVHAGAGSAPRTSSLEALGRGDLDILFAVDMFNEGVDVPTIGTVLMLRPTESAIVFLQQLGRGLRRAEGKTHLQVIDYIGNHRIFLTKVRALLAAGDGDRSVSRKLDALENGEPILPPGCEATYDLEVIDMFREMLRTNSKQEEAEAFYRDFKLRHGLRPTAVEMARADFDPATLGHGSWFEFVRDMGDDIADEVLVTHEGLLDYLERGRFKSADALVVLLAAVRGQLAGIDVPHLFGAAQIIGERHHVTVLSEPRFEEALQHWLMTPHFQIDGDLFVLSRKDASGSLPAMVGELIDWRLMEFVGGETVQSRFAMGVRESWNAPTLWQSYMREEIPPLFGAAFNPGNWNAGIVRVGNDLVLLTTLNKGNLTAGNHYQDRFLSDRQMQWQSQTQTRQGSAHGRILSGEEPGQRVHLFVRGDKLRNSKAAPFIYCGTPKFLSWNGEKPITVTWELPERVPEHLWRMLGVPA